MSDLLFDGLALKPPPPPTDRLFFALFPDPVTAARIAETTEDLKRQKGLSGRPLAPERFHITLHHLGDYVGVPESVVAAARAAADSLSSSPFEVSFDRAASFHGRADNRPFVLRVGEGLAGVVAFQQTLGGAMIKAGLRPDRSFVPHVTLLYDGQLVAEQAIGPIGWTVDELVLVHSLLGQTVHVPLGRWPLKG
jgi:2'-5' RNA ligase